MASSSIPYGRQIIDDEDIASVAETLRSAWLTTGPKVGDFERAFAEFCGAREGVAVNSGTAALHAAVRAVKISSGDEVIVPAITFAASSNAVVYEGGTPVFADVEPETLLIDPTSVDQKITARTRAIIAVDYGGQPADYDALRALLAGRGIRLIADACHAPGATYKGGKVGTLADLSAFSFHPVKHLTTCEGGMVLTDDPEMAAHMRRFRNHGIDSDHRSREKSGIFSYDMVELGFNYRLPDVQCALGIAQLKHLPVWLDRRRAIAARYDEMFAEIPFVRPLANHPGRSHAYHLYVIRLDLAQLKIDRRRAFDHLRAAGIGANVHYAPVYHHSFYRERFGYQPGLCPQAEAAYREILTLPMFPTLSDAEQHYVVKTVGELKHLR
ncbi:UDP-4-amino-4,6-dideoxy-N-acetyl-beta-L-altrosamine transaminase [Bradyrhizobium sp. CB2312]|uniref:UDP-4-amino-4, 6-dideoxy-N-acetyl-beta-L-altrosamine transaminase n=1 Tax=Bradyrhizobium sp. CB2312 TaxID=3039155 RepID=UPI0024B20FC7|nr:UDP-4-amino-4,6-dideoxy-N-acetyl-beta-L-altrosamine transaminase [Bradyrhizobium sp. CB2312]WFU75678.1 UDP-4-amino-4,6-dideoxy-N-acetyl-beta-L-altrosamine transaminase [Bradyrhizobium sp. CB2312]